MYISVPGREGERQTAVIHNQYQGAGPGVSWLVLVGFGWLLPSKIIKLLALTVLTAITPVAPQNNLVLELVQI